MYISFVEDGTPKCVWVQLKLENLVRTYIVRKPTNS